MLSIRDANALAQRGQYLEAAATYASLLFAYPDLAWSTIGGLQRCLNNLRQTTDWAMRRHLVSAEWDSLKDATHREMPSDTPRLQQVIEHACQHPSATLVYSAPPASSSDLLLGLLHRQLWGSQLLLPLPLAFATDSEWDNYVAKQPIWSAAAQRTAPSLLIRIATLAEAYLPDQTTDGSLCIDSTAAKANGCLEAVFYQLSGPVGQEELEILRELLVLVEKDDQMLRSVLALVDLLSRAEAPLPLSKKITKATPSQPEPADNNASASWMEEAVSRGLFCETFYRQTNPDLLPEANLQLHYREHGWREGRDPSQFFSSSLYLETYADVAASGMNPLHHYILHGIDRSRFASKIFDQERSRHRDAVDLSLLNVPKDFDANTSKIAILLHIHYPEVLRDILPLLVASDVDYDLLITATSEAVAKEIHGISAEYLLRGQLHVRVVTNRGRDIAAFINEFTDKYQDYDLICKLHGKKSPHLDHFGKSWRQYLITNTIGNADIVKRVAYFFSSSPQLGVFAPVPFKGTNNSDWAGNLAIAKELVAKLDGEAADHLGKRPLLYPSATVFWFRPQSLTALYRRYPTEDFPPEPLPVDGTVAHALERLIPFFAERSGYYFGCYRHRHSYLEWCAEYPILTFLQAERKEGRRKVLLFSHDASNTGAPRTAIGLHRALNSSGDVDCLAVVLGGGPLEERFHEAGPSLILPNGICLDVLANILEIAPRDISLICNTVVTSTVVEIGRNFGLHTISLIHEYASAGFWPKDFFWRALEADVCVFPGTSVLESAVTYCGKIPAHTCLLRPQGLYRDDFPRFAGAEARDVVRKELNLPLDSILIMGCGMIENRKGFDIFLDTAECMLKDSASLSPPHSKLAFIWVGSLPPSDLEEAHKQIQRIKNDPDLSESVHLLGQVPEADRYFAAADLFFLSSRFDPFPGVVLEAMAAGMPIICFRKATDVTDAFIPPCGGYALDQMDAREAATALQHLTSNPNLRMEMGEFARRRLRSHYSFESYTNALMPHLFANTTSDGRSGQHRDDNQPVFSIIVPGFRTPLAFLQQLIYGVLHQSYPHFELIIAAAELTSMGVEYLKAAASCDSRIRPFILEQNRGIAGNTNAALQKARGSHLCFLDHDDLLHAKCLQRITEIVARANPDFIYTDEDKVDTSGAHFHSPVRKPDFEQKLLEKNNYITHFTIIKRQIFDLIGDVRSDYDGAQDYDFILRATDAAQSIWHIPEVLYHWRESEKSTSSGKSDAKPYAVEAGRRALEDHLQRQGRHNEVVENTDKPFIYQIRQK
ncbi:MAG: rhamnan synthesis F family protein [Cyanobacteriota bacterium]|jgi:glycosyltransferase involved in cell wall biosynthesis